MFDDVTVGELAHHLNEAIRERDEAREVAFDYYQDLPYMGDYLFEKHHGTDLEEYSWLAAMVKERAPAMLGEKR